MFKKIKELQFLYEINIEGVVRNIKSKRIVKTISGSIKVQVKNETIQLHLNNTIMEYFELEIIQRLNRIGFKQLKRYIKEIPSYYFINKDGNIFSFFNNLTLKQYEDRYGYNYVALGEKKYKVHILLGKVYLKNDENKPTIDHLNGIRNDNRLENLKWATHKEQQETVLKNGNKLNAKKIYDETNDITFNSIGECGIYHKLDGSNISRYLSGQITTLQSKLNNKQLILKLI